MCRIKSIFRHAQHLQTQDKIECYHLSMKNVVKLERYYCPKKKIEVLKDFVHYYNPERYHESLGRHPRQCVLQKNQANRF